MSNKKLKLLFVSSDKYPPFRPAARAIFMEELPKYGYQIDWLIQSQTEDFKEKIVNAEHGNVYIGKIDLGTSFLHRLKKHSLDIANDLRMFVLIKRNRYDLIQIKDKYISAVFAIIAAKLFRIKIFYWIAFPHPESAILQAKQGIARYRILSFIKGYTLKFLLYKFIFSAVDHAFVQSEQMKKDIVAEGVSCEKLTPVPGSVNLDNIPYKSLAIDTANSKLHSEISILYLGTLNRMRHLDFTLRAFAEVLKEFPTAKYYLLGKGDTEGDELFLRHEAKKLGLSESVYFTGYLPMKEAWNYIRHASVCISPYYPAQILLSTSPTKLIEYMAMARPVVGNDHPEQKLVITESGAGICSPWDEAKFSDAIIQILSDPEMAEEMGKRGRDYVVKHRTNAALAEVVKKEYSRLCG